MAGPEFLKLESLTLSAMADIHPLRSTLPFSSRWVSLCCVYSDNIASMPLVCCYCAERPLASTAV